MEKYREHHSRQQRWHRIRQQVTPPTKLQPRSAGREASDRRSRNQARKRQDANRCRGPGHRVHPIAGIAILAGGAEHHRHIDHRVCLVPSLEDQQRIGPPHRRALSTRPIKPHPESRAYEQATPQSPPASPAGRRFLRACWPARDATGWYTPPGCRAWRRRRCRPAGWGYQSGTSCWRAAVDLLPPGTNQLRSIHAQIEQLGRQLDNPGTSSPAAKPSSDRSPAGKAVAGLGFRGDVALEAQDRVAVHPHEGKALAAGLDQGEHLPSPCSAFFAVYWTMWGWPFALGLVLSIYIHEMGHVDALRRYGFKATAPMFIPGLAR